MTRTAGPGAHITLVDAHVHLHESCGTDQLLDSAAANILAAARGARPDGAVLLLAQPAGDVRFERLAAEAAPDSDPAVDAAGWSFRRTAEAESILAVREDGTRLILVCGRQIRTTEGLEVLALATTQRFEDGRPTAEILRAVAAAGALAVLPWGVGKWFGRRGRLVSRLIGEADLPFACGDNGNRPGFWPRPHLLRRAERLGRRVLPGSDPLPLPGAITRAGSFGFAVSDAPDPMRPAAELKARLADPRIPIEPYGTLERASRFFSNQLLLRARRTAPPAPG